MSKASYRQQMFCLIEAWRSSGLSQKAFCIEQGITAHRFHYWHRQYKDQNGAGAQKKDASFIPLSISDAAAPTAELIYPDGRRLLFHQRVDAAFLKALLS